MLRLLLLVLIQSVFLCGGQVLMKLALKAAGDATFSWQFILSQLTNWWWLGCGMSFTIAGVMWMYILKHYPFSQAYPLSSMAYKVRIEKEIKEMPNYFADYDTIVHFITSEELKRDHAGIPHGGFVIRTGKTGLEKQNNHVIEYSLKLDSNPEFTASVIVAYARATYRMNKEGMCGCKTVFDVPPAYLTQKSYEDIIAHLL